jgi:NAD(P)-dependent dehydrogenase (short-subunit alcohol dehydrogenase family)
MTGNHRLDQRVVMVSGATGGMGAEIARQLLDAGARLSLSDLAVDALQAVARDLESPDVLVVAGDLSTPSGAEEWTRATLERFGRIDALVSVAGAWRIRPFLEAPADELELMIAANLKTAFYSAQAVAPYMIERGSGSIVNFASTAGEYGSISPAAHYAAAKGAVIGLTKSLARELSPLGVRVNAISPGPVDTAALAGGRPIDRENVARRTLVGRLGTPADIAEAVLYLVGDGATFVTGQVLGVNGGSRL